MLPNQAYVPLHSTHLRCSFLCWEPTEKNYILETALWVHYDRSQKMTKSMCFQLFPIKISVELSYTGMLISFIYYYISTNSYHWGEQILGIQIPLDYSVNECQMHASMINNKKKQNKKISPWEL